MISSAHVCSLRLPILLLTSFTLLSAANAQDPKAKPEAEKPNPALVQIKDVPNLPRVLLIGDSISIGYTLDVREMLKDVANVHRPPVNCRSTNAGLAELDDWLGDGKWDVIHFNWGLHDLIFLAKPGVKKEKPGPEDLAQQVPVEKYEQQLEQLVERLQQTGAKLIWCSTTPVPAGAMRRKTEDAIKYNEAALRVMQKHNVAIDDLYAFALPRLKEIQMPANVHFTPEGSKVLAEQVSKVIKENLKK